MKHKHNWKPRGVAIFPPTILYKCDCGKEKWRNPATKEEWMEAFGTEC